MADNSHSYLDQVCSFSQIDEVKTIRLRGTELKKNSKQQMQPVSELLQAILPVP